MNIIQTSHAPAAIGPYSQAIAHQGLLFCSGQIGLDPETMQVVSWWVEAEIHQVLRNIDAVLQAAWTSKNKILKTTIFLTDLQDFTLVNQWYGTYLDGHLPARSTIQVAGLPKGACVEIECVVSL